MDGYGGISKQDIRTVLIMLERERNRRQNGHRSDVARDLKPYLVSGGPVWWVAAYTREHARAIVLASEMDNMGYEEYVHDDIVDGEVIEQTIEQMQKSVFHDGNDKRSMASEFDRATSPGIIACSEF